ncbi:double-stranded RNA-specific editase Adar-like, partial [Musca vetustissima]|uniref:double-stranded RNA-specific editase Adar-like n=1 Tax=Musca vetustissima TaxID=27455 RepID=UPI002AB7528A
MLNNATKGSPNVRTLCKHPRRSIFGKINFVGGMSPENVLTPSYDMNGYSRKSPSKRRYEGSKYSGTPKKKPRTSKERVPQPKNTVAMLNELRHGLVYKLESQTGPVHAPLFTISVE